MLNVSIIVFCMDDVWEDSYVNCLVDAKIGVFVLHRHVMIR